RGRDDGGWADRVRQRGCGFEDVRVQDTASSSVGMISTVTRREDTKSRRREIGAASLSIEASDEQTSGDTGTGADRPAAVGGADSRWALRLRQRVSWPRVPQSAPVVPAAGDHLALCAGPDRSAAGR